MGQHAQTEDDVERARRSILRQIAQHRFDAQALGTSQGLRSLEHPRRSVEQSEPAASTSEREGDTSVAAAHVQDGRALPGADQLPHDTDAHIDVDGPLKVNVAMLIEESPDSGQRRHELG